MMGWVCALCGASNSPQLLQCPCRNVTATDTATTANVTATDTANAKSGTANSTATTATATASPVAHIGSKSLGSKTSTTRNRYNYNDPDFNQFWSTFPLRRGKAAAFARWRKVIAAGVSPQVVIAAAASYAVEVEGKEPQFIKWPEGWLSAGRWDDEPAQSMSLVDVAQRELDRIDAEREAARP